MCALRNSTAPGVVDAGAAVRTRKVLRENRIAPGDDLVLLVHETAAQSRAPSRPDPERVSPRTVTDTAEAVGERAISGEFGHGRAAGAAAPGGGVKGPAAAPAGAPEDVLAVSEVTAQRWTTLVLPTDAAAGFADEETSSTVMMAVDGPPSKRRRVPKQPNAFLALPHRRAGEALAAEATGEDHWDEEERRGRDAVVAKNFILPSTKWPRAPASRAHTDADDLPPISLAGADVEFNANVRKLVAYRERHHHAFVRKEDDERLHEWCNSVRRAGMTRQLGRDRRRVLNSAGFDWRRAEAHKFFAFLRNVRAFEREVARLGQPRGMARWFRRQKDLLVAGTMAAARRQLLDNCAAFQKQAWADEVALPPLNVTSVPMRVLRGAGDASAGTARPGEGGTLVADRPEVPFENQKPTLHDESTYSEGVDFSQLPISVCPDGVYAGIYLGR
jgi:hypothetical protein